MHFLAILIAWVGISATLLAQSFQTLRSEDYPIGEELPLYTQQIQLGKGVNKSDVQIIVEYPEYVELTKEEKKLLSKYNHRLPNNIIPQTQFGVERKCTVLEVGVLPFISKNNKPYRIKSLRIRIQPNDQQTFSKTLHQNQTSRYANNSVLANGKWVKIKVEKEGIYQITESLIKSWGFSDINKIKVFGHGGRIQPQILNFDNGNAPIDDLKEVATHRNNDKLLFFAEGTVRFTWNDAKNSFEHANNHYATASYYFITEGEEPLTISTLPEQKGGEPLSVISHPVVYDEDAYAWYEGGRQFYDSYNFANGNSKTFTLQTPSAAAGKATLNVSFSASSMSTSTMLEMTCNGTTVKQSIRACGANESAVDVKRTMELKDITDKTNVKFITTAQRNARLNYLLITYPRTLSAADAPYSFMPSTISEEPVTLTITNASKNTEVWQINNSTNEISKLSATLNNSNLSVPFNNASNLRCVIVNTDQTHPEPTFVQQVENQNLHADANVDMIIIVPESGIFDEQAQRLADAHHKHNNLRCKIVPQHLIFNEFGSGTPDATAIRRYVKMLYDRATTDAEMPKYLLFFGDCLFDNRMITEQSKRLSAKDYLLSYEDNDNYSYSQITSVGDLLSYPTDDYFGLLDDGEGLSVKTEKVDIAIGRFVCSSVENAKTLVDKSIAYLENKNVGAWKNQIVCIGDAKDKNTHMEDSERVVETIAATNDVFNIQRIYPDLYTRETTSVGYRYPKAKEMLTENIKKGALIFNYSGHGSPAQISHAFIFEATDWEQVASKALPLWVLASCEILPYDQPTSDFARNALFHKDGGAVAFVCASRAVYASENNHLNTAYCNFLLQPNADGSYNTMGEALRLAKNQLITLGKDRTINKLKYILAGDPALPLMFPKSKVQLDSINGQLVTESTNIALKAGSIARFSGSIAADFNGIITATLYDKIETLICKNNDKSADEPFTYTERTKVIFEGSDSIKNGKFAFSIPIPKDISYSTESGRISFYAVNDAHTIEAHGFNENFHLNGTAANVETTDSIGPSAYIYLNDPEFPNGGTTTASPIFVALLSDSSGINATGISVGHDIELQIDNDPNQIYVLNSYFSYDFGSYQQGRIDYQLEDLAPGRHTLRFRVWDLNNNATTQTLQFNVASPHLAAQQLYATHNPATTATQFVANADASHLGGTATFEVYSLLGQLLWTASSPITSATVSQHWDLCSTTGAPLPKGLYLYRVVLNSAAGQQSTDAQRILLH